MSHELNKHHRRSIRLRDYDYSQSGMYFLTICTHNRECLFGEVEDGQMTLNEFGQILSNCWHDLPNHYVHVEMDCFVVMPNHFHGIINIVGAGFKPAPTKHGLSEIVRALKTFSARKINKIRNVSRQPLWQRNYYEHIIRDESELDQIREYIANNPLKWQEDKYYTAGAA